jgi:hypothetical protein
MEERKYCSTIFDLICRWRWVVSFMPWPFYPVERTLSTHWIRLGGSHSWYGCYEVEKNLWL